MTDVGGITLKVFAVQDSRADLGLSIVAIQIQIDIAQVKQICAIFKQFELSLQFKFE